MTVEKFTELSWEEACFAELPLSCNRTKLRLAIPSQSLPPSVGTQFQNLGVVETCLHLWLFMNGWMLPFLGSPKGSTGASSMPSSARQKAGLWVGKSLGPGGWWLMHVDLAHRNPSVCVSLLLPFTHSWHCAISPTDLAKAVSQCRDCVARHSDLVCNWGFSCLLLSSGLPVFSLFVTAVLSGSCCCSTKNFDECTE